MEIKMLGYHSMRFTHSNLYCPIQIPQPLHKTISSLMRSPAASNYSLGEKSAHTIFARHFP